MLLVQQQKSVDQRKNGRCTENGKVNKLKEQDLIHYFYLNPTMRDKTKKVETL